MLKARSSSTAPSCCPYFVSQFRSLHFFAPCCAATLTISPSLNPNLFPHLLNFSIFLASRCMFPYCSSICSHSHQRKMKFFSSLLSLRPFSVPFSPLPVLLLSLLSFPLSSVSSPSSFPRDQGMGPGLASSFVEPVEARKDACGQGREGTGSYESFCRVIGSQLKRELRRQLKRELKRGRAKQRPFGR